VISFVATIASAFLLRNYWALVIGIMVKHFATVLLSFTMEPYRPRLCFRKINEIWLFSMWTLFRNIGVFLNAQIDKIAIGGVAGAALMGRYEVARDVATSPTQELINPVVTVLFPVMATVQEDHEKRRELYLTVLYWSALICVSTSVGMSLIAQDLVDLVLGPKWHDVAPLMPWFALGFGILGLSSSVYSAFDTIGQPVVSARLQWVRVLLLGAAVFPAAYYLRTLEAVAITRLVVTIAITPTLFYALGRAIHVPMIDFVAALWRPFAAGLFMAAAVLSMNAAIDFTGPWRLLLDVALGIVCFAGSLMALWFAAGRPEGPEGLLWRRISLLPGALRRYSPS
jgi:O-antigen/teichoic acid export membrane protein